MMSQVPEAVYGKAVALGEAGRAWLDSLDDLIPGLEREWRIRVGRVLEGGSEALVAEAVDQDGTDVILKVAMPAMPGNTVFENEVTALALVNGNGYARLIRVDMGCRAMLLERLGTPLKDLNLPVNTQIEIICRILAQTWIRVPEGAQLLSGDDVFAMFRDLIEELCRSVGIPSSERAVRKALQCCEARALVFDPAAAVLVHGDAHSGNLLQAIPPNSQIEYPFKLIDPDGIVSEPAYDLGVLMREWVDELLEDPVRRGARRCEYIGRLTNIGTEGIWAWGLIQCVATGLLLVRVGQEQEGRKLLQVADAWAGSAATEGDPRRCNMPVTFR